MSSPVSGEHHERALAAAGRAFAAQSTWGRDRNPEYVAMVTQRTALAIDAYFASLAEQGVRLVDLREVVEWLRARHRPQAAVFWADALERRFGGVSDGD